MVLEKFIEKKGIKVNSHAKIIRSDKDGFGVYIDVPQLTKIPAADSIYEILRIPSNTALNVANCVSVAQSLKQELQTTINEFITRYITEVNQSPSETAILTLYVAIFVILQDSSSEIEDELGDYLRLLQDTEISTPLLELAEGADVSEYYECSRNEGWETVDLDRELVELINGTFAHFKEISLIEFVHLKIVIRSRVLETPEQDDEDDEDFIVRTTLVPVLDFVNHDLEFQNAWFDVDRANNDILLKYEYEEAHSGDHELQLYIAYSPVEDLKKFTFIYGFIPRGEALKAVELSVDRSFMKEHYHEKYLLCKWWKVAPNVQFVLKFNKEDKIEFQYINLSLWVLLLFLHDVKLKDLAEDSDKEVIQKLEDDVEIPFIPLPGHLRFDYQDQKFIDARDALTEGLYNVSDVSEMYLEYLQFIYAFSQHKLKQLLKLAPGTSSTRSYELIQAEIKLLQSFTKWYDETSENNKYESIQQDDRFDELQMPNPHLAPDADPSDLLDALHI